MEAYCQFYSGSFTTPLRGKYTSEPTGYGAEQAPDEV